MPELTIKLFAEAVTEEIYPGIKCFSAFATEFNSKLLTISTAQALPIY